MPCLNAGMTFVNRKGHAWTSVSNFQLSRYRNSLSQSREPLAQPPSSLSLLPKLRNSPKPEPCLEQASDKRGTCTARPYPIQLTQVEDEEIESRHVNKQVQLQTWEASRAMRLMLRAGLLMTKNRRLGTGGTEQRRRSGITEVVVRFDLGGSREWQLREEDGGFEYEICSFRAG
jgi:hypothetical protein